MIQFMTSTACFRILLREKPKNLSEGGLAKLVAKIADAFLSSRWLWPRQYESITPYSFLLTDPRAEAIDLEEIARLSAQLQDKLFGSADSGEVCVLLYEGESGDIATFLSIDGADLLELSHQEPIALPFKGRLTRLIGGGAAAPPPESPVPESNPQPEPEPESADGPHLESWGARFCGVYFWPKEAFVGCVINGDCREGVVAHSVTDGRPAMPSERAFEFDLEAARAGAATIAMLPPAGLLYFPICFSSIAHRTSREQYQTILATLPASCRAQLAVTVYDVPRSPTFAALSQLLTTLRPYFDLIDLQVLDPAFEIDLLGEKAVSSVTLVLPVAVDRVRALSVKRFMENRDQFKRKRIWPAVTNVRTREDIDICTRYHVPFLSGAAISQWLELPVSQGRYAASGLPLELGTA
jgi:hypothetical protein